MIVEGGSICALSLQINMGRVFYAKGINYYNLNGTINTRHAEVDEVQKLKKNKKNKKVNIIVVRVSGNKRFGCAKPCLNCINYMKENVIKKGYRIHRIYYSEDDEILHHL